MIVVGIAGGSGSGKSTVCRTLRALVEPPSAVLTHDNYYRSLDHLTPAQRAARNFDHPDALDSDLLCEHLDCLRSRKPIGMPTYCFATHVRRSEVVSVSPSKTVFVEGVLIFSEPELMNRFDFTVYIRADDDVRLNRRLNRDMIDRGRTRASVIQQWHSTVLPMHRRFVEPFQSFADVVVENNNDLLELRPLAKQIVAMSSG